MQLVNSITTEQGGARSTQIIGRGWKIKGQGGIVELDSALA